MIDKEQGGFYGTLVTLRQKKEVRADMNAGRARETRKVKEHLEELSNGKSGTCTEKKERRDKTQMHRLICIFH